jgi:murein DD-endopeptidase MepM/ murein hydrolase activator NlpD
LTGFGWTRLAYLLVVLSVLGVLAQIGSPSADPRPLAGAPPEVVNSAGDLPAAAKEPREAPAPRASVARENPQAPAFARHLKRATAGGASAAPDAGKAVFYRPAPASPPPENRPGEPPPESGGEAGRGPVCGDLGRFPSGHRLVFPLPMQYASSYEDTWGAPRPQGGHEGTDLMVPTGTPEYAVTDGTVVPIMGSNGNGWNSLGGYALMLRAAYSVGPVREGDLFYYAHLDKASTLPIGATVRAGQVVGYAGDTGQGPEVTRGLFPPHLHFGWYDAGGARSYLPSGAMNPYPLLEWVKSGGGVLGGGANARYCEVPKAGAATPSAGGDRWPAPGSGGARPDLDTGTNRPAPSPTVAGDKARTHERQAGHANTVHPERENRAPGKGPREAPAKVAPEQEPRSPEPPPPDRETPATPTPRDEPAPGGADPAPNRPAGQGPKDDPGDQPASPDGEPSEGGGHPEEGQGHPGNEEPGNGEDEEKPEQDPPGDTGDQRPGKEEPGKGEKPEGDPAPPGGETTPDEDETDSGPDEDPETTNPEASGSESAETEPQPETTTAE